MTDLTRLKVRARKGHTTHAGSYQLENKIMKRRRARARSRKPRSSFRCPSTWRTNFRRKSATQRLRDSPSASPDHRTPKRPRKCRRYTDNYMISYRYLLDAHRRSSPWPSLASPKFSSMHPRTDRPAPRHLPAGPADSNTVADVDP